VEIDREKFEALLKRIAANLAKAGEDLGALEALLNEQATPGQLAKRAIDNFGALWVRRYRQVHVIANWPAAMAAMKRLLKDMPLDELNARAARYLESRDPFYAEARHPLMMFVSTINKWGATPRAELDFSGPSDCQHDPRCLTDAAHTMRRQSELRTSGPVF